MKIGIGIGLTTRQGVSGEPPIITATVAPSLGPLDDGDTIASAMSANYDQTSNYSSAAGTISTVVAAATVNGVAALVTDTVDAGDVVAVTVTVTDSEANERVFNAGSRTVADVAPVASGAIADQSYTEGLEITPLDVSEDFTGTRLTFALAPSSAALPGGLSLSSAGVISGTPTTVAAEVNIVVRATNSAGTADTAFGVTIAEASAFTPASLFASGEEGAWYEPSTTTAFRSTTDLTPCGFWDSCGFLLDLSKGAGYSGGSFTGLGPELVTNGNFADGATGWTEQDVNGGVSGYPTFTGGVLTIARNNVGGQSRAYQSVSTVAGKTYVVSADYTRISGGQKIIFFKADGIDPYPNLEGFPQSSSSGTAVFSFVATAAITFIIPALDSNNTVSTVATIDNISVRELPGNHATQATAAARPILARVPPRGRVNELSETDALATQSVTVTAAQRTLSFTGTGTVTLTGASTAGPLVGTGAGDRVSLTFTPSAGSLTLTVLGTVTDAQLELGASATTYQFVADSLGYDITEAGVTSLEYLAFDGSDDFLVTPATVNLSASDKLTVISGAEKESDALSVISDNGNNIAPAGTFYHGVGTISTSGPSWWASSRGTATGKVDQSATSTATFAAPITNVLTAQHDIPGDLTSLRVDGAANGTDGVGDKGTGNFANYNLWVGARAFGGGSLFFDGKLFSLIVRGAASTSQEISDTESYVANLSGVTLP